MAASHPRIRGSCTTIVLLTMAKNSPTLYVGTSGWAYSIWKPEFYPKDVAAKNFLKFYATQLNTVEVNYTFRRLLSEKAADSWMNDAGPEFRFGTKENQYITQRRSLKDSREHAE